MSDAKQMKQADEWTKDFKLGEREKEVEGRYTQRKYISWFRENGFFGVYSCIEHCLSIPQYPGG